ncbi:hypothetical protein K490DRAFT_49626 [Saccharata proteae CBS 121410]|uniref:INSIG-domain-containing protein n=1 Tax=Saccharata proteae CBS 121410 TaxID=1314787 RepID=A0A9P4HRC4_9PEZI|nr:hypothetical protein K490DRAFT_49626 [Saccharata proteae CBS 121410]
MPDSPPILRPLPRRPFELNLTPAASTDSHPSTPSHPQHSGTSSSDFGAALNARLNDASSDDGAPSRSRSILNLTSSTLFGIYSPTGYDTRDSEPATPWGTGAETPAREGDLRGSWADLGASGSARGVATPREGLRATAAGRGAVRPQNQPLRQASRSQAAGNSGLSSLGVTVAVRALALFVFGVAYGVIISHLHDNQHISPVRVEVIDRRHWGYLGFWGLAGVGLGSALPWVDLLWVKSERRGSEDGGRRRAGVVERGDWNKVVRSIGAFVGIAFAIRKLPWQSTLQVSLTLALVNPALWYLLDRSKPGFTLSLFVGLVGTAVLLLWEPDVVPSPPAPTALYHNQIPRYRNGSQGASEELLAGLVSYESVGVATWFASVLFCSCICFGNIGRKLALRKP